MLIIRPEQVQALEESANGAFEDRLALHARRFFPERVAAMTDVDLHAFCGHGVAAARGYGLVTARDLCKYVNLTLALGRDFDVDPALPWARAILTAEHISGPTLRINRLYLEAMERVDAQGATS